MDVSNFISHLSHRGESYRIDNLFDIGPRFQRLYLTYNGKETIQIHVMPSVTRLTWTTCTYRYKSVHTWHRYVRRSDTCSFGVYQFEKYPMTTHLTHVSLCVCTHLAYIPSDVWTELSRGWDLPDGQQIPTTETMNGVLVTMVWTCGLLCLHLDFRSSNQNKYFYQTSSFAQLCSHFLWSPLLWGA